MELLYSVLERNFNEDFSKDSIPFQATCCVSCQNTLVFSRLSCHLSSIKHFIPIYSVCAIDLNTPYETHVICECSSPVKDLYFNINGTLLIIVKSVGEILVYKKGKHLQDWTNLTVLDNTGEDILHCNFFHQGGKPIIPAYDCKPNTTYTEKINFLDHKATVYGLGDCPVDGFFVVAATGLVVICIIQSNGVVQEQPKISLGEARNNFTVATSSLSPFGEIYIAAWMPDIVRCWSLKVSMLDHVSNPKEDEGIGSNHFEVTQTPIPSFCPSPLVPDTKTFQELYNTGESKKVLMLTFPEMEDPSNLLVVLMATVPDYKSPTQEATQEVLNFKTIYFVQRYCLQEKSRLLSKFYKSHSDSPSPLVMKEWACVGEWSTPDEVLCVGSPFRQVLHNSPLPFLISVSTSASSIYIIKWDGMQELSNYNINSSRLTPEEPPLSKKPMYTKQVLSFSFTWSGLGLVTLDSRGSLCLLSTLRMNDFGMTWSSCIVLLLEFSLVTGYDWWDLLLHIPASSAFSVCDRLTEVFYQHSSVFIDKLVIRLSSSLQLKSIITRHQTQLLAMLNLFRSLRPVTYDIVASEKNPSLALKAFLENWNSIEMQDMEKLIDQFCYTVNFLNCQIDPSLAKDLQTLLQFATDLAVFLLFCIAQNIKNELAHDLTIINYTREILLLGRIWNRHNKLVAPQIFSKTDSVDMWSHIFKLLSKIASVLPSDPDQSFIEECLLLQSQVVCREIPLHIPSRGFLKDLASLPQQYYFGMEEVKPKIESSVNLDGEMLPAPQPLDPFFYHFLGTNKRYLQCSRCWAVRGSWWGEGETMWEQEWASRCICSGFWMPPHNQKTVKAA